MSGLSTCGSRVAFAAGFVPGSFSFPLDGSFATYLGWVIPWRTPVTLLGQTPEQVSAAQRELVRIGIDRPAAAATGQPQDWAGGGPLAALRLAKFGDLAAAAAAAAGSTGQLTVLDVRRRLEWEESHIAGAVHIPFNELPGRAWRRAARPGLGALPQWLPLHRGRVHARGPRPPRDQHR